MIFKTGKKQSKTTSKKRIISGKIISTCQLLDVYYFRMTKHIGRKFSSVINYDFQFNEFNECKSEPDEIFVNNIAHDEGAEETSMSSSDTG